MTKITNWKTKKIIIEDPNLSTIELAEKAVEDGISLSYAKLEGANLYKADLSYADLRGANLYKADLYKANLRGAYLSGANLEGADLYKANLRGADLGSAKINKDQLDDLLKGLDVKII